MIANNSSEYIDHRKKKDMPLNHLSNRLLYKAISLTIKMIRKTRVTVGICKWAEGMTIFLNKDLNMIMASSKL